MKIGDKVKLNKDIPSVDGMLYVGSIVKIDEIKNHSEINPVKGNIRVTDDLGKIWWVDEGDIKIV
jgi:hypothetical protein